MTAVEAALAAQRMSCMAIVLDGAAIDRCGLCGTTYLRRNRLRHVWSRRHERSFLRSWARSLPSGY